MDNEQKKEYLKSYKQAVLAVKLIEREIATLRIAKLSPSVIMDGMPHGSDIGDLSDYVVLVDEKVRELQERRYKRIKLLSDIEKQIEVMQEEKEKNLLRLKYIHFLTWEEVCVEMNYSWMQVHRIHAKALENFRMI